MKQVDKTIYGKASCTVAVGGISHTQNGRINEKEVKKKKTQNKIKIKRKVVRLFSEPSDLYKTEKELK